MIIISDTTPLSNFIQLDLINLLHQLWGTITIPITVANELDKGYDSIGFSLSVMMTSLWWIRI
jgi:predicted nucleic acid-binding protein